MQSEHERWYGAIAIEPKGPVAAGSYNSFLLTYTAGRYGVDNGGRLRLLFRFAWDGGTPQTTDPAGDNYVSAASSNPNVRVDLQFLSKGGRRPWLPCLMLEVKDDALAEGDRLYIRFGDTSAGGRGHAAQSFVESDFRWLVDVECFESGTWVELADCPVTPIIAGAPVQLAALGPSVRAAAEELELVVKAMDAYGNPSPGYRGRVRVSAESWNGRSFETLADDRWDGPKEWDFSREQAGVLGGTCRLRGIQVKEPGQYRFAVRDEGDETMRAVSNLVTIVAEAGPYVHHWGDLHGQYNNALGVGSAAEAFQYARDAGAAAFVGHQPNDFQFREEGWLEAKQAVRDYHEPGRFIPVLGYEWSGNTPAGGDRNVHFLHDDGPLHRSSHWHIPDKSDAAADRYPLDRLYDAFRGRKDVLLLPHVGGRRCDITRYYDPELEPVLEICSCHGRFEWLLREALANGYIVGVVGGSDDHTGRPGAAWATSHSFGTRGGLAGVYAEALTREGLFAALRARHTYATTGERIWLHVGTADGRMMGDHFTARTPPEIRVRAAGTAPLERVEIMRNTEVAYALPLFAETACSPSRVRLEWGGARVKGRGRHADWSGKVTVEGAAIAAAEPFAFDHPKQGIIRQDDRCVEWTSTTSGDHDGIVLTLQEPCEDAIFHFDTKIAKVTFALRDLSDAPLHYNWGMVDQYSRFSMVPVQAGPYAAEFSWRDETPSPGRNAYWLRLVQADGEMAWSSPMYVDCEGAVQPGIL